MAVNYSNMSAGQLANEVETGDLSPIIYVYLQVNRSGVMDMIKGTAPSFYDAFEAKMMMMNDNQLSFFIKNHILCGNIPVKELPKIQIEDGNCVAASALAMVKNRQTFQKKLV